MANLSSRLDKIEKGFKGLLAGSKPKTVPRKPGEAVIDIDRYTQLDELALMQLDELKRLNQILLAQTAILKETGKQQAAYVPQDKSLPVIVDKLNRIIETQAVINHTAPAKDVYFTYPPDGTKKTVSKGRMIIDFYEGVVKLPDGMDERISDSLRRLKLPEGSIRSFAIFSNQAARYSLDEAGLKPIDASDFQTERNQSFTKARLETTTDTQITIWASTNPDAFFGKLGATTTGGIIN